MKQGRFANNKSSVYGYLKIVKVINSLLSSQISIFLYNEYGCGNFCSNVSTIKIKREHNPEFAYLQCLGEGCKVGEMRVSRISEQYQTNSTGVTET